MSSSADPKAAKPAPAPAPAKPSTSSKSKPKTVTKASGAGTQAKAKKPSRKKKSTSKSSGAAATQAILNSARSAQLDLAKQKSQASARRSDPLWYRIEDVLPFVSDGHSITSSSSILPEQVQIVETVLGQSGLTRSDVTPQAMACLLEQARRFAQELITNAQDYAYSANRPEITRADLLLASEMRTNYRVGVSTQLPKLNIVAQHVNRAPLPPIPSQCYSGILLPPKQHQLTARTYDIVSGAQVSQKMVQKVPEPPRKKKSNSSSGQSSYGATRGRQIPIKLKEQSQSSPVKSQTPTPMDVSPSTSRPSTLEKPAADAASMSGQPNPSATGESHAPGSSVFPSSDMPSPSTAASAPGSLSGRAPAPGPAL
jgi:hypothetical protein